MARRSKVKVDLCAYCGKAGRLTRDHVIPKCLFSQPFPDNVITVPCCFKCNGAKSKNDAYLRDWVTTDIYGGQSPTAKTIFEDKVLRSSHSNRSLMAREFLSKARPEPLYTNGGIYLGHFPTAVLDLERTISIFSMLAQGLFYDHRRQHIPSGYVFEVWRYHPWEMKEVWKAFTKLNPNGPRILGNVFGCYYLSAEEDPATTLWLMWFYGTFFVSVSATSPTLTAPRAEL